MYYIFLNESFRKQHYYFRPVDTRRLKKSCTLHFRKPDVVSVVQQRGVSEASPQSIPPKLALIRPAWQPSLWLKTVLSLPKADKAILHSKKSREWSSTSSGNTLISRKLRNTNFGSGTLVPFFLSGLFCFSKALLPIPFSESLLSPDNFVRTPWMYYCIFIVVWTQ